MVLDVPAENQATPLDAAYGAGDRDRLRGTIEPDAVSIELVSAFSGDRGLAAAERVRIGQLQDARGTAFYSDLLYVISHQYFAPEIASEIWNRVLAHKLAMSTQLGRNVRVTVATLDYLSNITGEIRSLTLMSEDDVATIVNLSMRDGMTGLFNHSTCYELLELEFRNHRRYGIGVALIVLDVDDFKAVNDRYGHQEGDRILLALAGRLRTETRDSDVCCRFGGEEFAVILPFTNDAREAAEIAERIRLGSETISCHGQPITVSAGVALCDDATPTPRSLVESADRALYQAKNRGKNRVVVSDGQR
ncbi:MAG: GGDEF domain-containing protein [Deltaproteobacteria bacterium]|nr:GGDEF domain-containing protein [Deltaproteobacteria bacterium]